MFRNDAITKNAAGSLLACIQRGGSEAAAQRNRRMAAELWGEKPARPRFARRSNCKLRSSRSVAGRRRHAIEEGSVTTSESVTIIVKGLGWHRRIVESFMPFHNYRSLVCDILPCRLESVMKTLLCHGAKCRRWRWWRCIINRLGMRASNQSEWQQQRRKRNPCFHIQPHCASNHRMRL